MQCEWTYAHLVLNTFRLLLEFLLEPE